MSRMFICAPNWNNLNGNGIVKLFEDRFMTLKFNPNYFRFMESKN